MAVSPSLEELDDGTVRVSYTSTLSGKYTVMVSQRIFFIMHFEFLIAFDCFYFYS
jgi:hypothetical protein